jgi:hypothetical protein
MTPRHTARIRLSIAAGLLLFVAAGTAALAHPGVGIVRDAQGNVYYTDLAQVWKIPPQGPKSVAVPSVHTHELCLDSAGNLYGEHLWYEGEKTDTWGHRIWRRDPSGAVADVIGPRAGFRTDYGFVRDRADNMYWQEGEFPVTIRRRSPQGTVSTVGRCGSCRGGWMTVAPDGTLYFLDGDDLRRMGPDGRLSTLAKHLGRRIPTQVQVGERHLVMGLWTDAAGNVYAAIYGSREVKRIDPQGRVEVAARSSFPWSPTGGLSAPDGALWLLESSPTNRVRVRRVSADGRETIY